jgi:zinc D-Ala-D-Ala carboxypeptidase
MSQITPHFSIAEFTQSDTAARNHIDNSLPDLLQDNALSTCLLLERIRGVLSKYSGRDISINITSGFRCPELNRMVGSGSGSDHLKARAADFKAPDFGTPYNIASILAPMVDSIGIGQLIYEFDSWIHVSTVKPSNPVNRILTIGHAGAIAGIVK